MFSAIVTFKTFPELPPLIPTGLHFCRQLQSFLLQLQQKQILKFFYKTTHFIKYFTDSFCLPYPRFRSCRRHPCHSILDDRFHPEIHLVDSDYLPIGPSSIIQRLVNLFDFVILYYNISSSLSIVF